MNTRGTFWARFIGGLALALCAAPVAQACINDSDCNDGIPCTNNICFAGNCIFPDACPDALFCNGDETCNHGTGQCQNAPRNCQSPTPNCSETLNACVECLNNGQCTTAPRLTCSSQGQCVQCTTNNQCVDASFCNGTESCNFNTGLCQSGTPVSCPQGKFCSESLQRCVGCENDAGCTDPLACNGTERCVNDNCTAGTPVSCKRCAGGLNPGTPCSTNATCRVCQGGQNAGLECATAAQCPGGTCPAGGTCSGTSTFCKEAGGGATECVECLTDAQCNDNVFCTSDTCLFNFCNHIPDPMRFCDDGVFCNGPETCNANLTACQAGTPVSCDKECFRGPNAGNTCTNDVQCGAGGKCVGFCSESLNSCVQCEVDNNCSNSIFCDGAETCRLSDHMCQASANVNCDAMDTLCIDFSCDEPTDQCKGTNRTNGTVCDDGNQCTAADYCQNGNCVEQPPASNDPFRCVRLEWRPVPGDPAFPQTVLVGSTFRLALFAVATGCNEPNSDCPGPTYAAMVGMDVLLSWNPTYLQIQQSTSGNLNPQDPCDSSNSCANCQTCTGGSNPGAACLQTCIGGTNAGGQCYANAHCPGGTCYSGPVCVNGSNNGNSCTTSANCPGGTCNTASKCLSNGTCGTPPAWNWSQSLFTNDCQPGGDAVNSPCTGTVPGNDGNAKYTSISQLSCGSRPALQACASPTGLHVTTFKFRALAVPSGGQNTTVGFLPCFGTGSKTQIISAINTPPGYQTNDIVKTLGDAAPVRIVTCTNDASCQDSDLCTIDSCVAGACRHTPLSCGDPDACTIDTCSNGVCQHTPIDCGAGNVCYLGLCYQPCANVGQCNDGVACTTDACDTSPPPPIDGVCRHIANDATCDTGLFCQGKRCDLQLGCVFDNTCLGANGNPCPAAAACNEANDTCGGCLVPTVTAAGARYLKVTPANQGTTPVAILVQGDCSQTDVGCVTLYVQNTSGQLGPNPVYRRTDVPVASGGWGTVSVHGSELLPNHVFRVHTECNFAGGPVRSAGTKAKTWLWGDTNNDGQNNITDVANCVDGFKGLFSSSVTIEATNLTGSSCVLDEAVNILDISGAIDAFKSIPFPCGFPCQ